MSTPSLALPSPSIAKLISSPTPESASALAALINAASPPSELDYTLDSIAHHAILSSFSKRADIDAVATLLFETASYILPSTNHPGRPLGENSYLKLALKPAQGPAILPERLSKALFDQLQDHVSRQVTPDEEHDRALGVKYFADASVLGTLLARTFALGSDLWKDALWYTVEDALVKGILSGNHPEPGNFAVASSLFLGAGAEIKGYLQTHPGRGKDWVWYDNARKESDETWGWSELVGALEKIPDENMRASLPDCVKSTFDNCKAEVADGDRELTCWDSEKLAKDAFSWEL